MIVVTQNAWQHIRAAVNYRRDKEVAGFGHTILDGGKVVVDKILVPPQEIGGAHADMDVGKGDLDWLWGKIVEGGESPADWRFWWHSHAGMGTTPSSTDDATMKMLAEQFGGWACGAVFNNKYEATGFAAYYVQNSMFAGERKMTEGKMDMVIVPHVDAEVEATVTAWMTEHVKERVYVAPPTQQWGGATHQPGLGTSVAAPLSAANRPSIWYTSLTVAEGEARRIGNGTKVVKDEKSGLFGLEYPTYFGPNQPSAQTNEPVSREAQMQALLGLVRLIDGRVLDPSRIYSATKAQVKLLKRVGKSNIRWSNLTNREFSGLVNLFDVTAEHENSYTNYMAMADSEVMDAAIDAAVSLEATDGTPPQGLTGLSFGLVSAKEFNEAKLGAVVAAAASPTPHTDAAMAAVMNYDGAYDGCC